MHQQLFEVLRDNASSAFRRFVEEYPHEQVYGVALYTSGDYGYFADCVSTIEGLQQVAKEYLNIESDDSHYRKEWGTAGVAMKELKWIPCESPHHCEFDDMFDRSNELIADIWETVDRDSDDEFLGTCKMIHETAIAVLLEVRNSGIFNNEHIVFNLVMGDESDEDRLINAETLNSPEVVTRFRSELVIDEDILADIRRSQWTV